MVVSSFECYHFGRGWRNKTSLARVPAHERPVYGMATGMEVSAVRNCRSLAATLPHGHLFIASLSGAKYGTGFWVGHPADEPRIHASKVRVVKVIGDLAPAHGGFVHSYGASLRFSSTDGAKLPFRGMSISPLPTTPADDRMVCFDSTNTNARADLPERPCWGNSRVCV